MTKPHKWHKEIKAWADGAEIESAWFDDKYQWSLDVNPEWSEDMLYRIKPQKTEPLIISEEPVAIVYSMQDGYVGQMIKKGLPHKTLLYAHQDKPQPKEWLSTSIKDNTIFNTQPKEPQYLYVYYDADKTDFEFWDKTLDEPIGNKDYIGKIKIEE